MQSAVSGTRHLLQRAFVQGAALLIVHRVKPEYAHSPRAEYVDYEYPATPWKAARECSTILYGKLPLYTRHFV